MTHDPLTEVTSILKDAIADTGDVAAVPEGRDAAIAKLREALALRARARKRQRVMFVLAAAAAIVLAAGGVTVLAKRGVAKGSDTELARMREPAGAVTALREGHAEPLGAGARVGEGTELRTPAGAEVHLDFDSGTGVSIGGAARVRLVEQSKRKRFALEAGTFSARVAKLSAEERFVVTTSDAEIEVRGTAFQVRIAEPDPACGDGTPTRLEVTEGVVVVRHAGEQVAVAAGQRWPVCTVTHAVEVPTATGPQPIGARERANAPVVAATAPTTTIASTPAAPTPSSSAAISRLAQQNDLYDEAMKAKREGRSGAALATLDRLLATFPQGPLAENAVVERMRILAASDRARAKGAAQDYIARYPRGFARAEADALVSADP